MATTWPLPLLLLLMDGCHAFCSPQWMRFNDTCVFFSFNSSVISRHRVNQSEAARLCESEGGHLSDVRLCDRHWCTGREKRIFRFLLSAMPQGASVFVGATRSVHSNGAFHWGKDLMRYTMRPWSVGLRRVNMSMRQVAELTTIESNCLAVERDSRGLKYGVTDCSELRHFVCRTLAYEDAFFPLFYTVWFVFITIVSFSACRMSKDSFLTHLDEINKSEKAKKKIFGDLG